MSISLGDDKRDYSIQFNCGQETIRLVRHGCKGRLDMAARLIKNLDGKVDALGLGGANFFYHLGTRRYPCPAGLFLKQQAQKTPLVDGSGWKSEIEPQIIRLLHILPLESKFLVVSVLDRFWLADTLQSAGYAVLAGDAAFGLKIPLLFPLNTFKFLGYLTMPLLARLPLSYLYPLGTRPIKSNLVYSLLQRHFSNTKTLLAGDWHFIKQYLPLPLTGKVIITSGTFADDRKKLKHYGVTRIITTTPLFEGISPSANTMEAILTALGVKKTNYLSFCREMGWLPKLLNI